MKKITNLLIGVAAFALSALVITAIIQPEQSAQAQSTSILNTKDAQNHGDWSFSSVQVTGGSSTSTNYVVQVYDATGTNSWKLSASKRTPSVTFSNTAYTGNTYTNIPTTNQGGVGRTLIFANGLLVNVQ